MNALRSFEKIVVCTEQMKARSLPTEARAGLAYALMGRFAFENGFSGNTLVFEG